jgi:hypothetical protein
MAMRDEEIDWLCYMTLSRGPGSATEPELATATGLAADAVAASAARLERALLARREGERVVLVSVQESLVLCHARYGKEMPYVIENGVIRARRPDDA